MEKVLRFLSENTPFYLATTEEGRPRIRPLGFVALHEDKLYFGVGKHKDVYRQIASHPAVEVCATNSRSEWIRIAGRAVLDDNPAVKSKAFAAIPMLKDIYNEKTGKDIGFFYLSDLLAEFKDITGQTVQRVKL